MEAGFPSFESASKGSVLVAITNGLLVAAVVVVALPMVGIAIEPVLVLLLGGGIVGRFVARRPWVVEATDLEDPQRFIAFPVKGWRRSREMVELLALEIRTSGLPPCSSSPATRE